MSALPPKADIGTQSWNVRYVPLTSDLRLDAPQPKFASLFDEAGGVVRDMTEIDRTGEHA